MFGENKVICRYILRRKSNKIFLTIPKHSMQSGMGYEEAHQAALEYYNAKEFNLYSPDVIKSFPEYFNQMWHEFWGLERK